MAFPHRKLLPKKPDPLGVNPLVISKPCPKICVPPCPDDCNAVPPPPPPPPPPPHAAYNNSVVLLSVLCFLGFVFLIVSYVSIIRYRSKVRNSRRRNLHVFNDSGDGFIDDGRGHVLDHPIWYIRTVGLNQSVIDSIEVFRYKKGEGLVEGSACSVCLSAFQEDENLRLLPKCSHAFHIHCVDTWLRSHKNCPLCRAPVVNDASIERVAVEESNLDSLGSDEGNQVENVSNLAVLGSDEEGGDGGSEMRVNFIEDCTSLPVENNDVDKICDNNLCFGPDSGNKVRGNSDIVDNSKCINSLECPGGSVLSRSSTEAEYRGVAKVVYEA